MAVTKNDIDKLLVSRNLLFHSHGTPASYRSAPSSRTVLICTYGVWYTHTVLNWPLDTSSLYTWCTDTLTHRHTVLAIFCLWHTSTSKPQRILYILHTVRKINRPITMKLCIAFLLAGSAAAWSSMTMKAGKSLWKKRLESKAKGWIESFSIEERLNAHVHEIFVSAQRNLDSPTYHETLYPYHPNRYALQLHLEDVLHLMIHSTFNNLLTLFTSLFLSISPLFSF
jgi:hypothetical protein